MKISQHDATWAANEFIKYFGNYTDTESYLRSVKKAVIDGSGYIDDPKNDFFNEDIHPEKMDFDIRLVGNRFPEGINQEYYKRLLKLVSSHNNEDSIPGRELRIMVNERRSNKVVGFIRLQSPLINSKPRNEWLGNPPDL